MTPTAFRAALSTLGMSASSLAVLLGRPRNTVIAWGDPKRGGPPDDVARWLGRRLAVMKKHPPPAQLVPNSCSRIVPGNAQECPKVQSAETQADCQPIEIQGSDGGRDRD